MTGSLHTERRLPTRESKCGHHSRELLDKKANRITMFKDVNAVFKSVYFIKLQKIVTYSDELLLTWYPMLNKCLIADLNS